MERDPRPAVKDWRVPGDDSGKSRDLLALWTNQRGSRLMPRACWLMSEVFQPLA
jgi:hypothetical protein